MVKKSIYFLTIGLALVFAGAGCLNKDNDDLKINIGNLDFADNQKSDDNTSKPENQANQQEETSLILNVENLGNGQVKLTWETPQDQDKKGTYRLLRSTKENFTFSEANAWYQTGPSFREKVWSSIPKGEQHFRLCKVENEQCVEYSKDIKLEIE